MNLKTFAACFIVITVLAIITVYIGMVHDANLLAKFKSEHQSTLLNSGIETLDYENMQSDSGQVVIAEKLTKDNNPQEESLHKMENTRDFIKVHDGWKPPALPRPLQEVNQTDPDMITQIRDFWILEPDNLPLNLTRPKTTYFAQYGQDQYLDKLFQNKTGGFYVECGAFNGEGLSNTLYFERNRGWNGLLIEANPKNFASIVSKHRNALMMHACLSPSRKASSLNFTIFPQHLYLSRLDYRFYNERIQENLHTKVGDIAHEHTEIQCFPTYSILAALDRHVDFFSLDIETAEMEILMSIPFDKIDVDVFLIETCSDSCKGKLDQILSLMSPYGYKLQLISGDNADIIMSRI